MNEAREAAAALGCRTDQIVEYTQRLITKLEGVRADLERVKKREPS